MSDFSYKQQVVLATLAYHASLSMALSSFECYRFQVVIGDEHVSLDDVISVLVSLVRSDVCCSRDGLYTLAETAVLLDDAIVHRSRAIVKRQRATRIARFLGCLPWVREVYLSGSLAYQSALPGTDYDVFVVGRAGRLWSVALLSSLVLQVAGLRRTYRSRSDRVCLNHFVSTTAPSVPHRSMYNAQTYVRLLPVVMWGRPRFFTANRWVSSFVMRGLYDGSFVGGRYVLRGAMKWAVFAVQRLSEFVLLVSGRGIEVLSRWLLRRYVARRRSSAVAAGRVVYTNDVLEFHRSSPEYGVLQQANQYLADLGIAVEWRDSGLDHTLSV